MQQWHSLLLWALGLVLLSTFFWIHWRKWRRRKERDFTRRLETLLLPKEEVELVCPGREGRWVKTNQRLLMESGEGFFALPLAKLQRLQGQDKQGKATVSPEKMVRFTVNGQYSLNKQSPAFPQLAKALKARIRKNNALKKQKEKRKEEKKKDP